MLISQLIIYGLVRGIDLFYQLLTVLEVLFIYSFPLGEDVSEPAEFTDFADFLSHQFFVERLLFVLRTPVSCLSGRNPGVRMK